MKMCPITRGIGPKKKSCATKGGAYMLHGHIWWGGLTGAPTSVTCEWPADAVYNNTLTLFVHSSPVVMDCSEENVMIKRPAVMVTNFATGQGTGKV